MLYYILLNYVFTYAVSKHIEYTRKVSGCGLRDLKKTSRVSILLASMQIPAPECCRKMKHPTVGWPDFQWLCYLQGEYRLNHVDMQ